VRGRVITIVAAISLVTVGAAGAVAVNTVVHVRSGDQIIANKNLGCLVGPSNIVCGGAGNSRISANIRSDGEIVIQAQPTPHGVYPEMFIKKAECNRAGVCDLVLARN